MKSLLIAALSLTTVPTLAATVVLKNSPRPMQTSVSLTVSANAAASTSYAKKSSNTFSALRVRAVATGTMMLTMEGETKSQAIPPQNSDSEANGDLKILSNNQVELSNDGGQAKMTATIVRNSDGSIKSIVVSDQEMVKAVKTIIASSQGEQVRALQDNPALTKATIELSSMTCKGTAEGLSCDTAMKISMEMAQ